MKKILFIQSEFDFNQFFDKKIFPNRNIVEFTGIKYLNKSEEFFSKYDEIYSCDYFDIHASSIIKKAKNAGAKTFLLMDGIYDWANSHLNPKWEIDNCIFDVSFYNLVYCVDKHSASYLKLTGISTDLYKPARIFQSSKNDITNENNITNSSRSKILLSTSNTPYFNEVEFIKITNIFKGVINWSELNSVDTYCRIFDKKILEKLDIKKENNLTDGTINSHLINFDAFITTPSSTSVTAVLLDVPCIQIIYRDTPISFQSAWQIFNIDMIPEVLKSALNKDKNRMIHQRTILPELELKNEATGLQSKTDNAKNIKYSFIQLAFIIVRSKFKAIYYKLFKN